MLSEYVPQLCCDQINYFLTVSYNLKYIFIKIGTVMIYMLQLLKIIVQK